MNNNQQIPNPAEVLHRLRTDVPDAEILGTRPPIPGLPLPFRLRLADPSAESGDSALVAEWMSRPHLQETWEQPWSALRWRQDWAAKLSTTYAVPLILEFRLMDAWKDVGYVEIYRPHRDEIAGTYRSAPHDLGFHIAIGDPEMTGRGLFSPLLGQLAEALLAADPDCELVLVEPDFRNTRMHRALGKTAWTDCGERQQREDRRVRLFLYSPDAELIARRTT